MGGYGELIILFFAAIAYAILLIVNPIIAPKGKRLVVFFTTLLVLPMATMLALWFSESGLGRDWLSNGDAGAFFIAAIFSFFALTSIGFAIYLRVNQNHNNPIHAGNGSTIMFDPAKVAAFIIGLDLLYTVGRTLFYASQSNFTETLFKFYAGPMGLLSLAIMVLNLASCVSLWQHKGWAWWLAIILSLVPFGFLLANGFELYRTGVLPLTYLLTFVPNVLVFVLLLHPKTRQLCTIEF